MLSDTKYLGFSFFLAFTNFVEKVRRNSSKSTLLEAGLFSVVSASSTY